MNYFIDFIPSNLFIENVEKLKKNLNSEDSISLNIYIKQLPSMNVNELVYCDIDDGIKYIQEIKKRDLKVNIMLDTFCFGNREFTSNGKEIFEMLDEILKNEIDYITITNNFFFNYLKRRYPYKKIILSEYSEITNVQKIDRYLENVGADCVKLDYKLSLNMKEMEYIKKNFDINRIHLDFNKLYYDNDIYRDSYNNSLAHYIQEGKWEEIKKSIEDYQQKQDSIGNKKIQMTEDIFIKLKQIGYKNFWFNLNFNINKEEYLNDFIHLIKI